MSNTKEEFASWIQHTIENNNSETATIIILEELATITPSPVPDKVENAARKYAAGSYGNEIKLDGYYGLKEAFIAGAKWQAQQSDAVPDKVEEIATMFHVHFGYIYDEREKKIKPEEIVKWFSKWQQSDAVDGNERVYEIDFAGHTKAKIRITDTDLFVEDAMSGYGDRIDKNGIYIVKQ